MKGYKTTKRKPVIMAIVMNDFLALNLLHQSKISMRVGLETRKLNQRVKK